MKKEASCSVAQTWRPTSHTRNGNCNSASERSLEYNPIRLQNSSNKPYNSKFQTEKKPQRRTSSCQGNCTQIHETIHVHKSSTKMNIHGYKTVKYTSQMIREDAEPNGENLRWHLLKGGVLTLHALGSCRALVMLRATP